jgi:CheY-like chemotaxis protein
LLVEDEASLRVTTKRMLETLGLSVIAAENGLVAEKKIALYRERLACVILDMLMPVKSGSEALPEIRRIHPNVPVVIASGYDDDGGPKILAKIQGRLLKPYRIAELAAILGPLLR